MKNDTTDKTERDLSDRKFYPAEEEAKFEKSQPRQTPQTAHPAYKLAFQDTEFLLREELRPVRFQLELLKPEMILDEAGVGSTLVMYGSARIPPPEAAETALEGAKDLPEGERRVVDVLGVALGVAVGVDAHDGPGGGDELHGADGAVPAGVVVELAAVGVGDGAGALGAVERPWLDSTRPIAATSCQVTLQDLSAELMTVSARW